ncbi:MAG: hypothetical protein Q9213_008328 [Squamulea squamosa]
MAEPSSLSNTTHHPTLQVDYTWRKWKAYISDRSDPSKPLYIVHYKFWSKECIIVKSATDDTTVGTGTLHVFSINPTYSLHGRKGTIKALKRWVTSYTHLSYAYASSPDGPPVTMTWTSTSNFKTWDFVCLDEQQMPVAKFSANLWALKKIGNIEFLGDKATSETVRDEIVVTGLTLMYCMVLRTSSILSFFGAIFARTGPIKGDETAHLQQAAAEEPVSGMGREPQQVTASTDGQVIS